MGGRSASVRRSTTPSTTCSVRAGGKRPTPRRSGTLHGSTPDGYERISIPCKPGCAHPTPRTLAPPRLRTMHHSREAAQRASHESEGDLMSRRLEASVDELERRQASRGASAYQPFPQPLRAHAQGVHRVASSSASNTVSLPCSDTYDAGVTGMGLYSISSRKGISLPLH